MGTKNRESVMWTAVEKFARRRRGLNCNFVTRNFHFQNVFFDVIGYSTNERTFHVVECKKSVKAAGIGHAFGQLLAYQAVLNQSGYDFLKEFFHARTTKVEMDDFMSPITEGTLQARFYVGLTDAACRNVGLLQYMKASLPHVGIIRVGENGKCRTDITVNGREDNTICLSRTVNIPVRRIFNHDKFLHDVETRLRSRLGETRFREFSASRHVDKPFGDYLKIWFGPKHFHFEVLVRKRTFVEVGLHLEGKKGDNIALLRYFRKRRRRINKKLGDQVKLGRWRHGQWTRIYERWPRTELDEDYSKRTVKKTASFIILLQPMLDDWERSKKGA